MGRQDLQAFRHYCSTHSQGNFFRGGDFERRRQLIDFVYANPRTMLSKLVSQTQLDTLHEFVNVRFLEVPQHVITSSDLVLFTGEQVYLVECFTGIRPSKQLQRGYDFLRDKFNLLPELVRVRPPNGNGLNAYFVKPR